MGPRGHEDRSAGARRQGLRGPVDGRGRVWVAYEPGRSRDLAGVYRYFVLLSRVRVVGGVVGSWVAWSGRGWRVRVVGGVFGSWVAWSVAGRVFGRGSRVRV